MDWIDLHTHSTYSDGALTIAELVDLALRRGLRGLAVTDHDTVEGVAESLEEGRRRGLEMLAGVEVNAWHGEISMHVLGYGIRPDDPGLQSLLAEIQEARHERNLKIIEKLRSMAIMVSDEELARVAGEGLAGRPHIAQLLVEKKVVSSVDQAFARYLRRGGAGYAERRRYGADRVIEAINRAGGLAVLAHPGSMDPGLDFVPQLLVELRQQGLAGVEVHYPAHSAPLTSRLLKLAGELGLLVTGGTDFHGEGRRSSVMLGGSRTTVRVPYRLLVALRDRLAAASGSKQSGTF